MSAEPLFEAVLHERGDHGPHYTIYAAAGMQALRKLFPNGLADEMNFCLFSTSGVHGTYCTIEDFERGEEDIDGITFLIVQPRVVSLRYGNCVPKTPDDFAFLKRLRKSSWEAARKIGAP